MPRPRRSNLSRQSLNARRMRNTANKRTEEEQEIAREKRRVSMARLRASQSQEQSKAAREKARLAMQNRRANNRGQQIHSFDYLEPKLLNIVKQPLDETAYIKDEHNIDIVDHTNDEQGEVWPREDFLTNCNSIKLEANDNFHAEQDKCNINQILDENNKFNLMETGNSQSTRNEED